MFLFFYFFAVNMFLLFNLHFSFEHQWKFLISLQKNQDFNDQNEQSPRGNVTGTHLMKKLVCLYPENIFISF